MPCTSTTTGPLPADRYKRRWPCRTISCSASPSARLLARGWHQSRRVYRRLSTFEIASGLECGGMATHRPAGAALRRERMLAAIRERHFVHVGELSERFGISEVTVRNDLDELAARGEVHRIRGGAIPRPARAERRSRSARRASRTRSGDRPRRGRAGARRRGAARGRRHHDRRRGPRAGRPDRAAERHRVHQRAQDGAGAGGGRSRASPSCCWAARCVRCSTRSWSRSPRSILERINGADADPRLQRRRPRRAA